MSILQSPGLATLAMGVVMLAVAAPARSAGTVVYVSNADSQEISVLALDRSNGELKPMETAGVGGAAMPMALSPDRRMLYVALRSQPFRVDPASGRIELIGHVPTEKTPRGFAIDPSGRYLIAAGQESHAATVHAIDAATGALSAVGRTPLGKNPNWVEIVDLP